MKLIDLLSVISEYANVRVYNSDGKEIARYNQKDSIPNELNDEKVNVIRPGIDYWKGEEIIYIRIDLA